MVETGIVIYWDRPGADAAAALIAKPVKRSFSNAKGILETVSGARTADIQ